MSFFENLENHDEPPRDERPRPPWFGPPSGVLPATLPNRAVLFKNDRALMTVDHVNVYPLGVQFTLNLWMRVGEEMWDIPWELSRPGRASVDDPEFLRLGVEFSDGSSWRNAGPGPAWPDPETEPPGPLVMSQGGGGGGDSWSMQHWLWPLPSPGKLVFHASWPAFDVKETSVELDADQIREAATTAQVIWSK